MVRLPRFSSGTNWITMLSVTIRTATRSTSGMVRPSGFASAVRALAASAAIIAVTKTAPPEQSAPSEDASGMQLQPLKSMGALLQPACSSPGCRIMLRPKSASKSDPSAHQVEDRGSAMILLSNGGTNIQRAAAPSDTILVGTVDGV